jgi:hypothetical protein
MENAMLKDPLDLSIGFVASHIDRWFRSRAVRNSTTGRFSGRGSTLNNKHFNADGERTRKIEASFPEMPDTPIGSVISITKEPGTERLRAPIDWGVFQDGTSLREPPAQRSLHN